MSCTPTFWILDLGQEVPRHTVFTLEYVRTSRICLHEFEPKVLCLHDLRTCKCLPNGSVYTWELVYMCASRRNFDILCLYPFIFASDLNPKVLCLHESETA